MGDTNAATLSSVSPKDVLAAIRRLRDLPASAPIVQRAISLLENPDFVVEDVKKTLLSDSALAARILRLANSAYFGFRSEVQTISQAIVLLGRDRIRTLLRRVLVDRLLTELAYGHSGAAQIRRAALATATASCTLSQMLEREDAEEMLLAGLLHNIGELFFLSQFPQEYARAGDLAAPLPPAAACATVFNVTAAEAGRRLLDHWNFPRLYLIIVEHIDEPLGPKCPEDYKPAVVLVHTAKKVADAFIASKPAEDAVHSVDPEMCRALGIDDDVVAEVYRSLPQRMSLEQLQAGRT